MEDRKILVFYIGIGNLDNSEVEQYINRVRQRFFTDEFLTKINAEIILLPTRTENSSIECINPKYITEKELIDKHEDLMKDYLFTLNKYIKKSTDE